MRQRGFTLIEIMAAVVLAGMVSVLGGSLMVNWSKTYRLQQSRTQLTQTAQSALEFLGRQLQMAVPGSVRVSAAGECVEFMPVVGATRYEGELADAANGRAAAATITVLPYTLDIGTAAHVSVAGFSPAELYTTASPSSRADLGGAAGTVLSLAAPARFARNSPQKRLYLAADPVRFCAQGGSLWQYRDYGFSTAALGTAPPGGSTGLIAAGVSATGPAFALAPGADERRAGVDVALTFTSGTEQLAMTRRVLIRNVP